MTETLASGTTQDYQQSYAFDLVGNRLSKTVGGTVLPSGFTAGTTTSTYNARDQLLRQDRDGATIATFAYDANGSLTTQFDATGAATVTQGYDLRNRMTEYERADGSDFAHVRLGYDLREGRVLRQVLDASGTVTATERFLLDRRNPTGYEQVLVQTDAVGTPTRGFVLGRDVTAQVTPTTATTTAAEILTLLYDAHGSTRGLVDATGQLADGHVYAYDAFGVRTDGLPQVLTPLQFQGEWFDTLLQQAYHRHRYLSHATGQWNAHDRYEGSLGHPLTLHKYGFVHANPLAGTDPSGHLMTLVQKLVVAGGIAAAFTYLLVPATPVGRFARSYGILNSTSPQRIAIVRGDLGYLFDLTLSYEAISMGEVANDLRDAGHSVTFAQEPSEQQFVSLLNTHDIVFVLSHGVTKYKDERGRPASGLELGGTTTSGVDPVEYFPGMVTANEIDGLVSNPNLTLITPACELGETSRYFDAVNPKYLVTVRRGGTSGTVARGIEYLVELANGGNQASLNSWWEKEVGGGVVNPSNSDFPPGQN